MDSVQQQEYAEKRQVIDEILEQMNEKEAAIKQGELEERRLTEEAIKLQEAMEQIQKRQKELELRKKERIDETEKQREELSLLRRRLYVAFRQCHRARAKAKPRFFCSFIVKISNRNRFTLGLKKNKVIFGKKILKFVALYK